MVTRSNHTPSVSSRDRDRTLPPVEHARCETWDGVLDLQRHGWACCGYAEGWYLLVRACTSSGQGAN